MSKRANPTVVGTFVLGAIAILIALLAFFGSGELFQVKFPFVLYFDGSVNGLRKGAPVKYKGVEIGTVKEIKLPLGHRAEEMPIRVVIELDGRTLARSQELDEVPSELDVQSQIDDGLRAQLESESFVTGMLFVALEYAPGSPAKLHESHGDLPEIPTLPARLEAMQTEAAQILSELRRIDFAGLGEKLTSAAEAVDQAARSEDLRTMITTTTQALEAVRDAAVSIDQRIGPLMEDLHQTDASVRRLVDSTAGTLERDLPPMMQSLRTSGERLVNAEAELEATLKAARGLIDPQSPIAVQMQSALREIEKTARAARALIEYLERNPSALVRGVEEE